MHIIISDATKMKPLLTIFMPAFKLYQINVIQHEKNIAYVHIILNLTPFWTLKLKFFNFVFNHRLSIKLLQPVQHTMGNVMQLIEFI